MKTALTKLVLILATLSLIVGCSTNTQQQNTAAGAVTGAVVGGLAGSLIGGGTGKAVAIGAGIVAGALIGGYVGHSMDSSDQAKMYTAMNNPSNKSTIWVNTKTGARYEVTPTSRLMTVGNNPNCRKYQAVTTINGKTERFAGVACLQSDNTWKQVR